MAVSFLSLKASKASKALVDNRPVGSDCLQPPLSVLTPHFERTKDVVYLHLGWEHSLNEEWGEAIEYYRQAVEAEPKSFMALHLRGVSHAKLGHHSLAISDFSACVRLRRRCVVSRLNRSLVFIHQQRYEEAEKDLDRIISVEPEHVAARKARALILRRMDRYSSTHTDYLVRQRATSMHES